jgi:phospholipid transport system substrate-binding protein
MRYFVFIYFLVAFSLPALCFGEQPLDVLQQNIEEGLGILRDPRYNDPSQKKAQAEKLWIVTRKIFDFEEFSRRVLASDWHKFTPGQQKDFTTVLAEFLGKFYLRRVQARYNGETFIYLGQKLIGKSKALVEIKVLWKNLAVPVSVRMINQSGTWKVYDLSALGISAVSNYRAQFHWILKKQSPDQVIEILREKLRHIEKRFNA